MQWLSLLLVLCSSFAFAQQVNHRTTRPIDLNGPDSIVTIGAISIQGNKITHEKIIYREIEFTEGDKLSQSQLDSLITESRQNLINRSLFNFVTFKKMEVDGNIDIDVNVVERWYIWPIPIINFADRNLNAWWESKDFGRLNYGVDLRVDNFRGRMEKLNIIVQGGFDQMVAAKWTIPLSPAGLTRRHRAFPAGNSNWRWIPAKPRSDRCNRG